MSNVKVTPKPASREGMCEERIGWEDNGEKASPILCPESATVVLVAWKGGVERRKCDKHFAEYRQEFGPFLEGKSFEDLVSVRPVGQPAPDPQATTTKPATHTLGVLNVVGGVGYLATASEGYLPITTPFVGRAHREKDGGATPRALANARRLAAAWNVCDGIPTEDLERMAPGTLRLLLEACKDAQQYDDLLPMAVAERLYNAIAKAEGRTA